MKPNVYRKNFNFVGQETEMQRILVSLVVVIALASCTTLREPEGLPSNAEMITGKWVGNYKCLQGTTGVTLELSGSKAGLVEGTFLFYPTPSNPGAATGKFIVRGTYFSDGRLVLGRGAWIEYPEGYITVSLRGKIEPANGQYSGVVPECANSTFLVTKSLSQ